MNKNCIHDITVSSISDTWDKNVFELEDAITSIIAPIRDEMGELYFFITLDTPLYDHKKK